MPGSHVHLSYGESDGEAPPPSDRAPELADVRRYGRRLINRWVQQAREADRPTFRSIVREFLQTETEQLPVTEEHWPAYEHVNVQTALDAWLDGREQRTVGVTGYRHHGPFGIADLIGPDDSRGFHGPRPGNLARVTLPVGPDGETKECLRAAVVLSSDGADRVAILIKGSDPDDDHRKVSVEILSDNPDTGARVATTLRDLSLEHNVYRGQVVSFGHSMFGERGSPLRFHHRQQVPREALVLPEATFSDVRAAGRRSRPQPRPPARVRSAPQAWPAAVRTAGRRQDPHRPAPRRRADRHDRRRADR
jgi:hypothetical protein